MLLSAMLCRDVLAVLVGQRGSDSFDERLRFMCISYQGDIFYGEFPCVTFMGSGFENVVP